MPLVRIDSLTAHPARLVAIGDAVHHALIAAFAIPPDDMFQVLSVEDASLVRYDPSYLGVSRDDDVVIVQIILGRGRPTPRSAPFTPSWPVVPVTSTSSRATW